MQRRWFGTDGVRGTYGKEPMVPEFAYRLGRAAARFFTRKKRRTRFGLGRDTRASGPVLAAALMQGMRDAGGEVQDWGVLPTGAVALLTREHGLSAGAVVSASHNPAPDNGIKFFDPKGEKLSDAGEAAIEGLLEAEQNTAVPQEVVPPRAGHAADDAAVQGYFKLLRATLPRDFSLEGVQLVVDCSHGAAWDTTPAFLTLLGASVRVLASQPDGTNINNRCGSEHPAACCREVRAWPGSVGLCHDGDADRLLMVDEAGEILDGDDLLALLGTHWLERGMLPESTVVATVMSNYGLDDCLERAGGTVVRTAVGDRYVYETMRLGGYALGGEQSGHLVMSNFAPSGDGLLSALQVLRILQETDTSLCILRKCIEKYPQRLYNIKVSEKRPFEKIPSLNDALQAAEAELAGKGRAMLRYSGTEMKARLLLEGRDEGRLDDMARKVVMCFERAKLVEGR